MEPDQTPHVVAITGASSGFGRLAAIALARAGHIVVAGMRATTSRNARAAASLAALSARDGIALSTVDMDVQDQASVDIAVETILTRHGRIDVVAHNAGHMTLGPAEAFTPEQLALLYDINVVGTSA
jgi:NAD(P)-dependent dehydrogenase (short-subunit alcohol dehydrogenase family)